MAFAHERVTDFPSGRLGTESYAAPTRMLGLNLTTRVKYIAIAILVASIAVGVGQSWLELPVATWVALEPRALVGHGETLPGVFALWQLATYPWAAVSPVEVVFSIVGLYFFAGDLERAWGDRLFVDRLILLFLTPVFSGPESLHYIAPHLSAAALGFSYGRSSLSLRRLWLQIEQPRLKRAIERERNERLH